MEFFTRGTRHRLLNAIMHHGALRTGQVLEIIAPNDRFRLVFQRASFAVMSIEDEVCVPRPHFRPRRNPFLNALHDVVKEGGKTVTETIDAMFAPEQVELVLATVLWRTLRGEWFFFNYWNVCAKEGTALARIKKINELHNSTRPVVCEFSQALRGSTKLDSWDFSWPVLGALRKLRKRPGERIRVSCTECVKKEDALEICASLALKEYAHLMRIDVEGPTRGTEAE